jgi:hypothetical protein
MIRIIIYEVGFGLHVMLDEEWRGFLMRAGRLTIGGRCSG